MPLIMYWMVVYLCVNGIKGRHIPEINHNLPQMMCTESGECSLVDLNTSNDETNDNYWNDYNVDSTDDPWFELVANKLNRFPPPTYPLQTSPPISNIVRLPIRQVRPQHLRPVDLVALHATRYPSSRSSTTTTTTTSESSHSPTFIPFKDEPSQTSTETSMTSTVSHVVVFKMLLLIAFVAVPVVAATLPLLLPTTVNRTRRDDAIVKWATHSAILMALTHLASEERLSHILKLHDEAFVDALSSTVTSPIRNPNESSENLKRMKEEISRSVLKLLQTVKQWDGLYYDTKNGSQRRWDEDFSSEERSDYF